MPIYEYVCDACGHQKDVLQRMSAEPLSICPACNADQFRRRVSASGFRLKGTGWYETDFKTGSKKNLADTGGAKAPASDPGTTASSA